MLINEMKWAEINLDNLVHNMKQTRKLVGDSVKIAAVVKANGYGHGVMKITETLLENGADLIAVSSINEAVEIRKKHKRAFTMVLGYTMGEKVEDAINHGVILTIYSYEQALECSKIAEEIGVGASIHIKIDTGMNRLGFLVNDNAINEILKIAKLPNIKINGIFSHFACADAKDKSVSIKQYKKFINMLNALEDRGLKIPIRHMSNSAAIIDMPEYNFEMVRPGIMLYGLYPSNEVKKANIELKPVMSLKSRVSNIKTLEEAGGISYGLKHVGKKGDIVATIPIGYADGLTRLLSNKGEVIIKDNKYKIVGAICMDQCMVDVTGSKDIKIGDEVILFGETENNKITVEEIAEKIGTINYEVVCTISRRVPRIYIRDNEILGKVDYLK